MALNLSCVVCCSNILKPICQNQGEKGLRGKCWDTYALHPKFASGFLLLTAQLNYTFFWRRSNGTNWTVPKVPARLAGEKYAAERDTTRKPEVSDKCFVTRTSSKPHQQYFADIMLRIAQDTQHLKLLYLQVKYPLSRSAIQLGKLYSRESNHIISVHTCSDITVYSLSSSSFFHPPCFPSPFPLVPPCVQPQLRHPHPSFLYSFSVGSRL